MKEKIHRPVPLTTRTTWGMRTGACTPHHRHRPGQGATRPSNTLFP